jgi:hypothetical protein
LLVSSKDNAMALMFMAACWSRSAQWLQSGHVAVPTEAPASAQTRSTDDIALKGAGAATLRLHIDVFKFELQPA